MEARKAVKNKGDSRKPGFADFAAELPGMLFSCTSSPNLKIISASGRIRQITGLAEKQVFSSPPSFKDLVYPSDWAEFRQQIQAAIDNESEFQAVCRLKTGPIGARWILAAGNAGPANENNPPIIKGILLDISLQKQTDLKLARLSDIVEISRTISRIVVKSNSTTTLLRDACSALTENGAYLYARVALLNPDGSLIAGYQSEFNSEQDSATAEIARLHLTRTGERAFTKPVSILSNLDFCRRDKGRKDNEHTFIVPLTIGARTLGLASVASSKGLIIDEEEQELISEIAAEIAYGLAHMKLPSESMPEILDETGESFREFMQDSPVGIAIIRDDTIIYANRRTQELLKPFPPDPNILNLSCIYEKDLPGFEEAYAKFTANQTTTMEVTFRTQPQSGLDYKHRMPWISCRLNHIKHHTGDIYLASFNDISHFREMEEHIRIQDKMSTLGRVSSEIAHEVRNPLSVINLNANSLLDLWESEEGNEIASRMLQKIKKASGNIEKTVRRILTMSKSRKAEFILGDINEPVREAAEVCSDMLTRKRIDIDLNLTDNLPPCQLDGDLMQQVIVNLISNAVEVLQRQTPPRIIKIGSANEDDCNIIRVSDSGPGIPPEDRELVFEPFYSTKEEGTGIGLSLCHRLIKHHNGTIRITESEWGGAEMTISIPVV